MASHPAELDWCQVPSKDVDGLRIASPPPGLPTDRNPTAAAVDLQLRRRIVRGRNLRRRRSEDFWNLSRRRHGHADREKGKLGTGLKPVAAGR